MRKFETSILVSAYCTIAFVSLSNPSLRPDAGLPSGNYDHLLAYLLLGALTAWVQLHLIETRWFLLLIPMYAALLELGQLFIPGRNASVETFVWSAVGAITGVLVGKGARLLFR